VTRLARLALFVVLSFSAAFAGARGSVHGKVNDSEGAAIKKAHVLFHPDASGRDHPESRSEVTCETNATGQFEVELEPGFYDVCVMATAFTPVCTKTLVTQGQPVNYDARLKADPLITQYFGDTF
jgi:hypothetical protein